MKTMISKIAECVSCLNRLTVFVFAGLLCWLLSTPLAQAQPDLDFGDAPDPTYPTLLPLGAFHANSGLRLGTQWDSEPNGQPSSGADGDDLNPPQGPDDEDGVFLNTAFISGVPGTLKVMVTDPAQQGGFLQGWVDFNADGDWADGGEQIINNVWVNPGLNTVPFNVPVFQVSGTGTVTYARFRLAQQQNLSYTGGASTGEVEDYLVQLYPLKWLQPPDLTTNGVDVDNEFELADDFLCTQSGPVTDIHIWGSFQNDYEGVPPYVLTNMTFLIRIYSDMATNNPQNPLPYSHPDKLLWQTNIFPGQYRAGQCGFIPAPGEWWHSPAQQIWQQPGDFFCYQFDFYFGRTNAWSQTLSNIYWLSVQCVSHEPGYQFGWKSTYLTNRWNDDAVWWNPGQGWTELRYGDGHPYAHPPPPQSLDLAFAVSTEAEEQLMDFGDAPDNLQAPRYPTLLAHNGARHVLVPGVTLGAVIDAEADGQPNATATGDDNNPPLAVDDEEGVTFAGTLVPGQPYTINVTASVAGFLNAWVDFNADGSWAQAADQIYTNQPLPAGMTPLTFMVPSTASWGTNVFARFRFTTATNNLGYVGLAPDGEVEDYLMTLEPFPQHDLGDAPASLNNAVPAVPMTAYPPGGPAGVIANFPTALVFPGPLAPVGPIHMSPTNVAFLGNNVTFESNADIGSDQDLVNNIVPATDQPDQDGADDGVLFPLTLPHCWNTVLNYTVTFNALPPPGTNLYVNVWFDWNRDGDWNDVLPCPDGSQSPEWAVPNQIVPAPPGPYPMTVTLPTLPFRSWHPLLTNQPIWMRITLSEQMWPPPGGGIPSGGEGPVNGYALGETEDYYITHYDTEETFDFGDTPAPYPTVLPNGARHRIVPNFLLGTNIDNEANGLPDPLALGDDLNPPLGTDDEDGVKFVTPLLVTTQACVDVFLTGPIGGTLDAWVDFNRNGAWDHPAERVFNAQTLVAGLNAALCFHVPTNAVLGTNFARFRLSSTGGLTPAGAASDGEVEDYLVVIHQRPPLTNIVITNIVVTNLVAGGNISNVVLLQWNAQAGVQYQVQTVATLSNAPPFLWTNVGPVSLGPANTYVETNSVTREHYYRVLSPWVWP